MSSAIDPGDEDFTKASSRLTDGLRSCRAVVSNYRALLSGEGDDSDLPGFSEPVDEGDQGIV